MPHMHKTFPAFALALAALPVVLVLPALAQAQAVPQAQQASPGPSDFVNAALQVVTTIDRFDMAGAWDRASAVMKARVPKEQFVANTAQRRALLGAVRTRDWMMVSRVPITQPGGQLPPGQYMTVRLRTLGQNSTAMEEVVSFHLDPDGQWRLAGYALQ